MPLPQLALALALGLIGAVAVPVAAQEGPRGERGETLPEELENVGVTERLDARVPLDAVFRDETGREVALGEYFGQGRPVVLNLMYLGCPMLCGLIGNGLNEAMKQMDWTAGSEFTVLSLSFDHTEKPSLAKLKKMNYLEDLDRPEAAAGWHFLTGDEEPIRRLTEAVGFGFAWNERRQEYAHAAVLVLLTPDGRIARYLYGVQFDPKTLRLSLVEAADGKIGTTRDQILLFCFNYDASTGRYGPAARNLMKAGGLLTIVALAILIIVYRAQEGKRRQRAAA
jgi:protein SCO1/2